MWPFVGPKQKAKNRAHRLKKKNDRREAKLDRIEARQSGKTDRKVGKVEARQEGKSDRVQTRADAGKWDSDRAAAIWGGIGQAGAGLGMAGAAIAGGPAGAFASQVNRPPAARTPEPTSPFGDIDPALLVGGLGILVAVLLARK